ncbi:hypothetical protein Bbelb_263760 [Branchiostoma belcheri]|nr:hypothetical protein Bbelb_263760 [Branchiostoma belcheri]
MVYFGGNVSVHRQQRFIHHRQPRRPPFHRAASAERPSNDQNWICVTLDAIDLQFLSKPLGGPSSRHFFPSKRATYHPDFVTPACVDHEISKLEVQLQYHNKPLGGPNTQVKISVYVRQSPGRRNFPA